MVYAYEYHCSKRITTPRECDFNIKGVELEIDDCDADYVLQKMVDNNLLTNPENEEISKEYTVAIENDASVYKELIIKASGNRKLLDTFKMLEEELHDEVCNSGGTSAHFHINRNYLNKRGVNPTDVYKATEFLMPILYKISGRTIHTLNRWAPSTIGFDTESVNLLKRCYDVDCLSIYDIEDRYYCVNPTSNTIEIRVFSNESGFNYNYLKLYLETIDFIIDLGEEMADKSYETNYNIAINATKEFFNKPSRKWATDRHGLNIFFSSLEEQRKMLLENKLNEFRQRRNSFNAMIEVHSKNTIFQEFIRILRKYNDSDLTIKIRLDNLNFDDTFDKIEENLQNKINEIEL